MAWCRGVYFSPPILEIPFLSWYFASMTKEADVLKSILAYLKELGIAAYRSPNMPVLRSSAGGMYLSKAPVRGLPDITGVIAPMGRALYIEVKAPREGKLPFEMNDVEYEKYLARKAKSKDPDKERREEVQSQFLWKHAEAGALCMVARSVEDVQKKLIDAGYFCDIDAILH